MEDLSGQKVAVISDLHLDKRFSNKRFAILEAIINNCDKIIIDGDLYEGYALTLKQFLNSSWQKLFPLFSSKKAVYVFGNHDKQTDRLDVYEKFCAFSSSSYRFKQDGTIFHLEHGHQQKPTLDLKGLPRWLIVPASYLDGLAISLLGKPYLNLYAKDNRFIKLWKADNLPAEDWLICGHTHLAEIDETAHYANVGQFKVFRLASYLIIENGKVNLHYING